MTDFAWASAGTIADAVNRGEASAIDVVDQALRRIDRRNPVLNAFTAVRPTAPVCVSQRSPSGHSPECRSR